MSSCCKPEPEKAPSCCAHNAQDQHEGHGHSEGFDWMMWLCAPFVLIPYALFYLMPDIVETNQWTHIYIHSIHEFVNATWWGVVIGILFLALMSRIPREFVMSVLGHKKGAGGIARAMAAGVLLDLCSHGILMIGSKLYQRGASAGQLMAFLIASPWNSISLTFIMFALIGVKLTLIFLALSVVIAFISGMIFDWLVAHKVLPENPNAFDMPEDFKFFPEAKRQLSSVKWGSHLFGSMIAGGIKDSGMVIRWLLFGIVIASALRVFIDAETFTQYFGPSILGLSATIFFATVMEVCSEGSSPIAADFVTRAGAPGNAFAFLMAGVSTDYTEIGVIKSTTKSWKLALFLPLITLPQIIILAVMLNL
jgi:uncharacterized protein